MVAPPDAVWCYYSYTYLMISIVYFFDFEEKVIKPLSYTNGRWHVLSGLEQGCRVRKFLRTTLAPASAPGR